MDKRLLRNKKVKPRNARQYDRSNQSILGKVASKVKGLFNPSWLFNVSQWMSSSEEQPGCSTDDVEDELSPEDDFQPHITSRPSKRPKLSHDHNPAILNAGTQTWLDSPSSSSLFSPTNIHAPSATSHSSLIGRKEPTINLNGGDDHSENSDGSASTSGCSSLVSSHKDRPNFLPSPCLRLRENAFENLRGEINDNRKNVTPQKNSLASDVNSSRSPLWSSTSRPSVKYPRSPSVIQSNQPSFNLSKFIGPSKLNPLVERKVASPFYEGKTSFGGASSNCRTSLGIAPYQVERPLRNHIRVQVKQSEDSLEGMSSAAKRILQTLEKMSSPVMDAKKIPNTNKSPVDLSLYLTPRKARRNTVLTPTSTTKGPPIADISTISRLATLKNHGLKRCRISPVDKISTESSILNVEEKEHRQIIDQGGLANSSFDDVSKGGGGKMRTKLNQQHRPCKEISENEVNYDTPLPNVPLPISKLPTFTFHPDSQVDKTSSVAKSVSSFAYQPDRQVDKTSSVSKGFVFSDPIELMLPNSALPETSVPQEGTTQTDLVKNDQGGKSFTFSSPIEHTLPAPDLPSAGVSLPKSTKGFSFTAPSSTWECGTCWVRNPETENKCLACETWRLSKEPSADVKPSCSDQPSSTFKTTSASADSLFVANTSQTSVTSGFKFGAGVNTFVSSASTNKTTGFKIPINSASSHTASFGGFSLDSCKTSNSVSTTENSESHSSEIQKSTAETCITTSASNSTISSLSSSKPMIVCTSEGNTDSIKETPSPQQATSNADTSSVTTPAKETESTFLKGNVDISNTAAFKSNPSVESVTPSFPKAFIHNDANLWECDTCLVRNSQDKVKCIACETLRPSKGNSSEKKDLTSFKFSSPLQSSPLIFKFGNPLSTCQSTDTSSSFKFGVPPKTTVSSFFGTPAAISDKINVSKAVEASSSSSTVTSETPSSNKSAENQKPILTLLMSEKKGNTEESKQETTAKVVTEATSSTVGKSLQTSNANAAALFGQSPTVSVFGALSSSTETQAVATSSSTSSVSAEPKPFSVPVVYNFSLPVQQQDSKKGLFTSPAEKLSTAFSLSKSQTASADFLSKNANIKASGDLGSQNADQVSSTPKESLPVSSGGSSISFQLPTNSQPVTSSFTLPISVAPVFKFGEKSDSSKTVSEPSSKSGSIFQSMNTTPAVPTFNFINAPSNTIASSTPKPTETQATSNNLQFQPSVTQNQDVKAVSITPFCTAATSNSFTFGASTAVSASAPSGFSFFGSAATSVATGNTSGFTFGAPSNTAVESKPGGFTFKSDEKPSLATSNAPTFNAPTANTASSSVFKFGASAPVSTGGFVFGVPKTEPQNVTPAFSFGTGAASASNESTFSGFQPNQSATPSFQFGAQTSVNSLNNTPAFGVTNTFAFGSKNDTTNQLSASATQQPTAPAFGTIQPVFGNPSTPSFGKVDKPASGGFNFGAAASSNPVFVFGPTDKKPALTPGFSFGTPTQSETPNSFQTPFNMNTPPSFNFGATSTPAGPFQFAASSESTSQSSSAPRKYRKALRRGLRKQE